MTIKAEISKQELFDIAAEEFLPATQQQNYFIHIMLQSLLQEVSFDCAITAFESTRSLWATLCDLIAHDHVGVGLLIGLFGIIISFINPKGL